MEPSHETTPPAPANVPDRLARLLPVIRLERRDWLPVPARRARGVAVFRRSLVVFAASRGLVLPENVFVDDDGAALRGTAGVREKRRVELARVQTLSAARAGGRIVFRGVAVDGALVFALPRAEAGHVLEALGMLLGPRFASTVRAEDLGEPRRRSEMPGVVLSMLVVLGGVTVAIQPLFAGQRDFEHFGAVLPFLGMIGAVFGVVHLGGRLVDRRDRTRTRGREPFRSPRLGLALRIAGFICFLLGYFFPFQLVRLAQHFSFLTSGDETRAQAQIAIANLGLVGIGALALYFGYRFSLRGADTALRSDARRPVLYLRSFGDDGKNNLNPKSLPAKLLGLRTFTLLARLGPLANLYPLRMVKLFLGTALDTAEEQLASAFRHLGPFVAIGRPGEALATGGAERLYVKDDAWREKVLELIDRSAGVILQPAGTEGVQWEIRTSIERVPPGRLLLCVANYEKSHQAYEEFRLRFEDLPGVPMPRTRGRAHFLWIDAARRVHALPTQFRSPYLWPLLGFGVDLERTLWPFLHEIHATRFSMPPVPARQFPGRWSALGAVVAWSCVISIVPAIVGFATNARRQFESISSGPTNDHAGRSAAYAWSLPRAWKSVTPQGEQDVAFRMNSLGALAWVVVLPEWEDPVDAILKNICNQTGFANHTTVRRIDLPPRPDADAGWRRAELHFRPARAAFDDVCFVDVYAGPRGRFALFVEAPEFLVGLMPGGREILLQTAAGFRLPPPREPAVVRNARGFVATLPAGWVEAGEEALKQSGADAAFQLGIGAPTARATVDVIDPLPRGYTPAQFAERVRLSIAGTKLGASVTLGDVVSTTRGGETWWEFRIDSSYFLSSKVDWFSLHNGDTAMCVVNVTVATADYSHCENLIRSLIDGVVLAPKSNP